MNHNAIHIKLSL